MRAFSLFLILLFSSSLFSQTPPASLNATSATNSQVALSWTAGDNSTTGYILQRRTLGGSYVDLLNSTTPSAIDKTIDAYTTYQYRVLATSSSSSRSQPSNEITVGPPPVGFSSVAPAPSADNGHPNYGRNVRMVLDQNGDPAIAFLINDPNGDGDYSDSKLVFIGWSRTQYKWRPIVDIAITGDVSGSGNGTAPISIARDASTNRLGIAYPVVTPSNYRIDLATSTDNGASWKTQQVMSANPQLMQPSLALAKGQAYLGLYHDTIGVQFLSGAETAAPATWRLQTAPIPSGFDNSANRSLSVATDSLGNPGIAYLAYNNATSAEVFWRPSSPASVKVADNNGQQTDDPDIQLTFVGTSPRIIFAGARDDNYFADYNHLLWSIKSTDNGDNWSAPVNIPSDGNRALTPPITVDTGSQGQVAVATEDNGGNSDNVKCGQPKIARSSDFVSWQTCGPAPADGPDIQAASPSIRFGANDRLWIAFQQTYDHSDLGNSGVYLWREPLTTGARPQISTGGIVNAANFAQKVAPGMLATIFGSNFASTSDSAHDTPLPTTLAGVSVTVNGRQAPVQFAGLSQINIQIPYETQTGDATIVVSVNGVQSAPATVPVTAVGPGIFVFNGTRAVMQNADSTVNEANNPAKVGSAAILYGTGLGALDNPIASGAAATATPLSRSKQTVTLKVGNTPAQVLFAGMTPGFVGLMQINFIIPDMPSGTYPVVVSEGGEDSNAPQITITR